MGYVQNKLLKRFYYNGWQIMHNDIDNGNLIGFSFCFTGTLESMTRNEAAEKVKTLGGVAVNSITRGLSFLVTNDTESGTSKNREARKNNIRIINEKEFTDIINAPEKASDYKKRGYKVEVDAQDIAELALADVQKEKNERNKILPDYEKFIERYKAINPLFALCSESNTGNNSILFNPPVSVEIVYCDSKDETTQRKIDIVSAKCNIDYNHIYAFCHLRNRNRTFNVHRILHATAHGNKIDIVQHLVDAYRRQPTLDDIIRRQILMRIDTSD
jgi:hypothetical protein